VSKSISKPGGIHLKIIEVLKRFPDGISGGQIRSELEKEGLRAEDQLTSTGANVTSRNGFSLKK